MSLHGVSSLLRRPVHQLLIAHVSLANHVAATKCIKAGFQTKCQNLK